MIAHSPNTAVRKNARALNCQRVAKLAMIPELSCESLQAKELDACKLTELKMRMLCDWWTIKDDRPEEGWG